MEVGVPWVQDRGTGGRDEGQGRQGSSCGRVCSHRATLSGCCGTSCSSCLSSAPIAVPRAEACTQTKLKMSKFTEVNGGAAD